jgi:D-sedoheptulose 7-phosphate isomerase
MNYIDKYLDEAHKIIDSIDKNAIGKMVDLLNNVRENNGRLFILGVGGGAGHASHAVNDFRKICGIEAYTPTDK